MNGFYRAERIKNKNKTIQIIGLLWVSLWFTISFGVGT